MMEQVIRGPSNLLFLQVEEIDKYLFVDNVFTLSFWVLDLETNLPRTGEHWLVNVTISYDQPHLECSKGLLDVISCSGIDATGYGKVQFKVRDISMNHGNKRFCLIFDGTNPNTSQTLRGQTNPFVCVRHKLVIREENQTPYAWYKDEGGKDKCIEFQAILIDGNNTIVLGRQVPLRAVLMYYGGQPVLQQNILTVSPDSRAAIDETGIAKIKLRINEVSNRHRGQLFQVLVSPHFNDDVSPALSMPVEVRSKRNVNSKRDASQLSTSYGAPVSAAAAAQIAGGYPAFGSYGSEEFYDSGDSILKRARLSYVEGHNAVATAVHNLGMAGGVVPSTFTHPDAAAWMKPAYIPPPVLSAPTMFSGSSSSSNNSFGGGGVGMKPFVPPLRGSSPASVALADLTPERQYEQYIASFRAVVGWTHKVLNSLQSIQWLQIGFDSNSSSSGGSGGVTGGREGEGGAAAAAASSSSPSSTPGDVIDFVPSLGADLAVNVVNPVAPKLFHMTNPNDKIKDIVEMYRNSAKGSLEYMKQFIEGHHSEHQQIVQMKTGSPPSASTSTSAPVVSAPAASAAKEWSVPQSRPTAAGYRHNSSSSSSSHGLSAADRTQYRPAASIGSQAVSNDNSGSGGVSGDRGYAGAPVGASRPSSPLCEEELSVNLVLAKSVLFAGCFLGTPVFNVQGTTVTCVGFYECYSHNNVAKINFHSLKSQVARLSLKMDKVVAHIQSLLSAETSIDTGNALFHLSQSKDLRDLKETAMCACILNDFENYY